MEKLTIGCALCRNPPYMSLCTITPHVTLPSFYEHTSVQGAQRANFWKGCIFLTFYVTMLMWVVADNLLDLCARIFNFFSAKHFRKQFLGKSIPHGVHGPAGHWFLLRCCSLLPRYHVTVSVIHASVMSHHYGPPPTVPPHTPHTQ